MHPRTTRALAAAAVLALGACADVPTGTAAADAPAAAPTRSVSARRPTLTPNAVRYRDQGGRPASGRAGSAVLHAFALLDRAGVTRLELAAASADPASAGLAGTIEQVRIRALDGNGTPMFVRNVRAPEAGQPPRLAGLAPGHRLEVQAHVTGVDGRRTDVVTVTEPVRRLADLAVRLEMAGPAPAGRPVPVTATVRERNGDLGALADCRLRVNGSVVDQASGVWVDAGDAVTCAFTHAFPAGTHHVQVEAASTLRPDWDDSDNLSQTLTVQAVSETAEFTWSASARAEKWRGYSRSTTLWRDPVARLSGESEWEDLETHDVEVSHMSGFIQRGLAYPLDVEISQTTGSTVVHADAWTEPAPGCVWRWAGSVNFWLCSYLNPEFASTHFTYSRNAGTVTYHSRAYAREWDEVAEEEIFYYHHNYDAAQDFGPNAGFLGNYAFHVKVARDDVVLTADSWFPLQHELWTDGDDSCDLSEDPWSGLITETCFVFDTRREAWSGQDSSGG